MPQLDPAVFTPQVIWLAITFVVLYFLVSRLIMPRMSAVFEQREDRIEGNLARAERIREEAAQILAAYEKMIADARADAHALLLETASQIAAESARRQSEYAHKLSEQEAAAEARIRAAKTQALADLSSIAGDVAAAMAAKLTGTSVDTAQARQTVDQVMKERR